MDLKKAVAQGAIAALLGAAALGPGVALTNAEPDWGGGEHDEWEDADWRDSDWKGVGWRDWEERQEWKRWNDHDWDRWWRANKWRSDDRPPWGWGPPPAVHWRGHPPHWIDYWGFRVYPVWFPHIKVFGFWLFGVFIPVIVI